MLEGNKRLWKKLFDDIATWYTSRYRDRVIVEYRHGDYSLIHDTRSENRNNTINIFADSRRTMMQDALILRDL